MPRFFDVTAGTIYIDQHPVTQYTLSSLRSQIAVVTQDNFLFNATVYENIRLVYEIESRVREFKRANTPAEPAPEPKDKERKNNTSGQPEQKQERNYSQGENQPVLASLPNDPPVVTVTTYRRFS